MRKKRKLSSKLLTLVLALAIIVTAIPLNAYLGDSDRASAATRGTLKKT